MGMDWSELPHELLEIIGGKLVKIYIDYVRFRAVCVKWRSSVASIPHYLPTQLPWLLFHCRSDIGTDGCYLDLSTNKFHLLNLTESRDSHCCGSSHGWLVFVEEYNPAIRLINPLTRNVIHLPPLTTLPNVLDFNISNSGAEYLIQQPPPWGTTFGLKYMRDFFIKKVVLSSSPNSRENDYIALIIFGEHEGLAFHKKGVEEWFLIKDALDYYFLDAIYYNGSFYALTRECSILICDLSGVSPIVTLITESPRLDSGIIPMVYLVDSFGELMLVNKVNRYMDHIDSEIDLDNDDEYDDSVNETIHFSVFKYDSSKPEWVQMDTLGDHMLFLGGNSSVCLSASDYFGCERNCIYFSTDDTYFRNPRYEFGVYHLDDNSILPLPYGDHITQYNFHPPTWVTPNPC